MWYQRFRSPDSGNGKVPNRYQTITWTNGYFMLNEGRYHPETKCERLLAICKINQNLCNMNIIQIQIHVFKMIKCISWWLHQMKTFSMLLALCAGNALITGEFPSQWPVTRSFDVFFDLCLNKQLSKRWICQWFEMQSCSLWHHCNRSWRMSHTQFIVYWNL